MSINQILSGEISTAREYFWHWHSASSELDKPIVRYHWDEEYEQSKITRAQAVVASVGSQEHLKKTTEAYQRYVTNSGISKEAFSNQEETKKKFLASIPEEVPEALVDWHTRIEALVAVADSYALPSTTTFEEYLKGISDVPQRRLELARETYQLRKKKVETKSEFWEAAVETYGYPACGFLELSSRSMM